MKQLTEGSRIPPQAVEVEKSVLGCILINQDAINKVMYLEPYDFYNPTNQKIYEAMITLRGKRKPIDAVTVVEELKAMGKLNLVEDPAYITGLTNTIRAVNIEYYGLVVLEYAVKRSMIQGFSELANRAFADIEDVHDLAKEISSLHHRIANRLEMSRTEHISKSLKDVMEGIEKVIAGENMHEVVFGFRDLDHILGGAGKGELIVVSGLDKAGKTSSVLQVVNTNAKRGVGTIIFSQEMKASQVLLRMAILESKINWLDFQNRRATKNDIQLLNDTLKEITSYPIYIDDHNNNINEIETKTKKMVEASGVKLCVVDYIQIVQGDKTKDYESREREVSDIAMRLKILARENDIAVIALSQLIEDKTGKLSTRESRAIQQHLDKWILIKRDMKKVDPMTLNQEVDIKLIQRMGISEEFGRYKLQYLVSCGAFVDTDFLMEPPIKQEEIF